MEGGKLGPEHPDTAESLTTLAALYELQGIYAKADPLVKRALAINEKTLGPEHPSTANSLNNLAGLYGSQGLYAKAEPLHQGALAIQEKTLGLEHPDTAISLNNLALINHNQGLYAKAEPPGPPKSVSMACWRGLTALALVGGNGSPPCPKSLTQQLISLIPAI